jgi:hypothetical protein
MIVSWREIVADLISGNKTQRARAFKELGPSLILGTLGLPSDRQIQEMSDSLLESDDMHEIQVLLRVLTWLNRNALVSFPDSDEPAQSDPKKAVAEWFWKPLQRSSISFRAWEQDRRRDEDAMLELTRYLSFERYPNVHFERVTLNNYRWGEVLHKDLSAVVFVGRLGVYGDTATGKFSRDNWFRFLSDERPKGLGWSDFDPLYHRICEHDEKKQNSPKYLTQEADGKRTDYGLVQRYVVPYNAGEIVVIGLWGCSSLGTLAAVKWAIDLENNNDPPPRSDLELNTPLEALVKVQAETCSYPGAWNPEPVQLEWLHIGNERWNRNTKSWNLRPNLVIQWEAISSDRGRIILPGETHTISGLNAKIMSGLVKKKLPSGTVIDLEIILSKSDLKRWNQRRGTYANRIEKYTGQGVVREGTQSLRLNAILSKC